MIAYFVLPDFPRTTTWLSDQERELAVWRLEEDIGEDDWTGSEAQTFGHGFNLAIKDLKMWVLVSGSYTDGELLYLFDLARFVACHRIYRKCHEFLS